MFSPLLSLIFALTLTLVSSLNTTSNGVPIVQFPHIQPGTGNCPHSAIVAHSVYVRYQDPLSYTISVPSNVFTKIPGLTFAVHHKQPALYQLQFQGTCVLYKDNINSFVRFLIEDRALISNYLLPNNDERHLLAPELGPGDLNYIDHRGGSMIYSGSTKGVGAARPKSDIVYMPEGTHII